MTTVSAMSPTQNIVTSLFDNIECLKHCLQCFYAVGWATGRSSGLLKLSCGMLTTLAWCVSDLQICIWFSWCHCYLLSQ